MLGYFMTNQLHMNITNSHSKGGMLTVYVLYLKLVVEAAVIEIVTQGADNKSETFHITEQTSHSFTALQNVC